jgi:predicted ATPase
MVLEWTKGSGAATTDAHYARQARSLELRAALSLARLWSRQGSSQAGRDLLVSVYGTFTEGFQTHDLQSVRAFLEQDGANHG